MWWPSLFAAMEMVGLAEKLSIYFLLSKTHSRVWAKTIALAMQFENKSYPSISMWGVSP